MDPHNPLTLLAAAAAGALAGGVVTRIVERVPVMLQREIDACIAEESGNQLPDSETFNLLAPRTSCAGCGRSNGVLDSVPVLGYVACRGRCPDCARAISPRRVWVPVAAAVLSTVTAAVSGAGVTAVCLSLFLLMLLALALIDADTRLLPDMLTLPLLWAGLLVNLDGRVVPLAEAVVGAAAGYMLLWTVYWVFRLATGKEGMGYGDFKFLAAIGAWLGWKSLPLVMFLSSLIGAIVGIALIVVASRGRDITIPFGPYLAAAAAFALFLGPCMTEWFLSAKW